MNVSWRHTASVLCLTTKILNTSQLGLIQRQFHWMTELVIRGRYGGNMFLKRFLCLWTILWYVHKIVHFSQFRTYYWSGRGDLLLVWLVPKKYPLLDIPCLYLSQVYLGLVPQNKRFSSPIVHYNSVWMTKLVVETLTIASYVFVLFCCCWSCLSKRQRFFQLSLVALLFLFYFPPWTLSRVYAISLWHVFLSWSNWPHHVFWQFHFDMLCSHGQIDHDMYFVRAHILTFEAP